MKIAHNSINKCKGVPLHALKAYEGVELHSFLRWHYMEVSGHLHALAALPPKTEGWVGPRAILDALEADSLLSLLEIEPEFLSCPVHCPATILTMLSWLLKYAHGSRKCPIFIMIQS